MLPKVTLLTLHREPCVQCSNPPLSVEKQVNKIRHWEDGYLREELGARRLRPHEDTNHSKINEANRTDSANLQYL